MVGGVETHGRASIDKSGFMVVWGVETHGPAPIDKSGCMVIGGVEMHFRASKIKAQRLVRRAQSKSIHIVKTKDKTES